MAPALAVLGYRSGGKVTNCHVVLVLPNVKPEEDPSCSNLIVLVVFSYGTWCVLSGVCDTTNHLTEVEAIGHALDINSRSACLPAMPTNALDFTQ